MRIGRIPAAIGVLAAAGAGLAAFTAVAATETRLAPERAGGPRSASVVEAPGAAMPPLALDLAAWKAHLERLTRDGSWWWTSNAAHAEADGIDAFATRYRLEPGGIASQGCLWGMRAGSVTGVYWRFFQGWDASVARPFYFQSNDAGATGFGHETRRDGDVHEMEQDFVMGDGAPSRMRHRTTFTGQDTMVTASFDWQDGQWQPRRTYTWIRRPAGETPCP